MKVTHQMIAHDLFLHHLKVISSSHIISTGLFGRYSILLNIPYFIIIMILGRMKKGENSEGLGISVLPERIHSVMLLE